VNFSKTYRIIASLLAVCILSGILLPAGLYAISMDHCGLMQDMHEDTEMSHSNLADLVMCPMEDDSQNHHQPKETAHSECLSMKHTAADESGFDCNCSAEKTPLTTEAPVVKKVKIQVLSVLQIIENFHIEKTEFGKHAIHVSDSYSPPPIFLLNESFLI